MTWIVYSLSSPHRLQRMSDNKKVPKKDVINIIYYLYALVYWKIFYIWLKSILGNHEITLYGYFLSSDINWNGSRWIDIYCSSTIDHWWNYRTCNVTFVNNQRGVCKVNGNESEMVHCRSYAICYQYLLYLIHQCLDILFRCSNRSNTIIFYQEVQNIRW